MGSKIQLSGKASTLESLAGQLEHGCILPLFVISPNEWKRSKNNCLKNVQIAMGLKSLIVRSSSSQEDSINQSMAGKYESVLNVSGYEKLEKAIDKVLLSYGSKASKHDKVLIQPMLNDVLFSGVAFSVDPNTLSPYRVINYFEGDDTTAVTGGRDGKTFIFAAEHSSEAPASLAPVIKLIEELESLVDGEPLDIEFAVTKEFKKPVLLQVRPLIIKKAIQDYKSLEKRLTKIEKVIKQDSGYHPFLHGQKTVFGIMPDWNPAEIIGVKPRPLALSLYKELITNSTWAYQRNNYGYKNLRSFPLLIDFFGIPYIDVRVSFNSFLPKGISGTLADKLVDFYINKLIQAPALHDKVEFGIIFSCYTFDLPSRISELTSAGFSRQQIEDISENLLRLTNTIVHHKTGLWRADRDKLTVLKERHKIIMESNLDPIKKLYWLLEDCKRYGTLPFAGLARAAFVAIQLLRSIVAIGILSKDEYNVFLESVKTVGSELVEDKKALNYSDFLLKYGHLRPGTYDITSLRYDEDPNLYFNFDSDKKAGNNPFQKKEFSLNEEKIRKLNRHIAAHRLATDAGELLHFIREAIRLREEAKFIFTRNLSDALSLITMIGAEMGFTRDELSYAEISTFHNMNSSTIDGQSSLNNSIIAGKTRHEIAKSLNLPPTITEPKDVWQFFVPDADPNFITQKSVIGRVILKPEKDQLEGSIIFIPSADPGFDWLFSYPIAGLITKYGGANSHMAIRAGELSLPAVIGSGEYLFDKWSSACQLKIDCSNRKVEILS